MHRFITFLLLLFIIFISAGCSKKNKQLNLSDRPFNIFLIAHQGTKLSGKAIGCDDVLVSVNKDVKIENSIIYTALNELMTAEDTDELKNYFRGPLLMLARVSIANNIVDVYLTGDFRISGPCDISRIREQLSATLSQFNEYQKIRVYVNDLTFEQYLNVAGKGF